EAAQELDRVAHLLDLDAQLVPAELIEAGEVRAERLDRFPQPVEAAAGIGLDRLRSLPGRAPRTEGRPADQLEHQGPGAGRIHRGNDAVVGGLTPRRQRVALGVWQVALEVDVEVAGVAELVREPAQL